MSNLPTPGSPAAGSPVLIVGSMALDSVKTPTGEVKDTLGGAADYSGVAASFFSPVQLVGVVGDDFPPSIWSSCGRGALTWPGCRRWRAGRPSAGRVITTST